MISMAPRYLVAAAACIIALSCGDVPTFADSIVSISPIVFPSPAVAAGDQLRDSTGAVAPLRVQAYNATNAPIQNVSATFVVSSVPPGVTIDAKGIVTALDSVRTVQVVGRVGDRLQTTIAALEVVPQPDSIEQSVVIDSLTTLAKSSALQVRISALRGGVRVPVKAIIVRYQITRVNGLTAVDSNYFKLLDDGNSTLRSDPRLGVDTTDAGGVAARFLTPVVLPGTTSVEVEARATNLRGAALKGSPIRFVLPVKKGP